MEQNKLNQQGTQTQRYYPNGLPITLDMEASGGPVKDIEPPTASGYSKDLDKLFKTHFPAIFEAEAKV